MLSVKRGFFSNLGETHTLKLYPTRLGSHCPTVVYIFGSSGFLVLYKSGIHERITSSTWHLIFKYKDIRHRKGVACEYRTQRKYKFVLLSQKQYRVVSPQLNELTLRATGPTKKRSS